jgi:hypothetical protein
VTVPTVEIPEGDLRRSRVVADLGVTLRSALDRGLTGYVVVEPQDALLLDDGGRVVLTFEDGVPVLAYDPATDTGGDAALGDVDTAGPSRVEVYELPTDALASAHRSEDLRVPPAGPAERLASDSDLAARTREAAPADRLAEADGPSAVEEFLADADRIEEIREEARAEAAARADEWGLTDQLSEER